MNPYTDVFIPVEFKHTTLTGVVKISDDTVYVTNLPALPIFINNTLVSCSGKVAIEDSDKNYIIFSTANMENKLFFYPYNVGWCILIPTVIFSHDHRSDIVVRCNKTEIFITGSENHGLKEVYVWEGNNKEKTNETWRVSEENTMIRRKWIDKLLILNFGGKKWLIYPDLTRVTYGYRMN